MNIHPHAGPFVIAAGAILGICAGLLWTAQGSLMLAYPTGENDSSSLHTFRLIALSYLSQSLIRACLLGYFGLSSTSVVWLAHPCLSDKTSTPKCVVYPFLGCNCSHISMHRQAPVCFNLVSLPFLYLILFTLTPSGEWNLRELAVLVIHISLIYMPLQIGFLILTLIGVAIPMFMANPDKMIRTDGSKVTTPRHPSWISEIVGLYVALRTDPAIILLFPMFLASNWFYTWRRYFGVSGIMDSDRFS